MRIAVALFLLTTACSTTTIIYTYPEGGDVDGSKPGDATADIATTDGVSDAGLDGDADPDANCDGVSALPNFNKTDDCAFTPQLTCPSCAPSHGYACGAQTRPAQANCLKLDNPPNGFYYCCPSLECHRTSSADGKQCGDGGTYKQVYSFACPGNLMPPQNFCAKVGMDNGNNVLCCTMQ